MWYCPKKYERKVPDLNEEFLKLDGELDDKASKLTLAQFLRNNLGFAVEIISGIKLAPYQEVALKGFFNRTYSMCVWGRGCAKSFIAAVFSFLVCLFEPGTKVIIAGPTFRTARFIFNELEKICKGKGGNLLAQALYLEPPSHKNDLLSWNFSNGSSIRAIPLNGEKIRGFRANVLIIDEFLLMSEDMVKNVLMPFLMSPQNVGDRLKIKEDEDRLIEQGIMSEGDRTVFESSAKLIALSSASYTFENLYSTYKEWIQHIYEEETEKKSTYFVSQISYQALPKEMVEATVIEEASSGGLENPSFLREYCAQFTDGSKGYFSAIKMKECTIPDGHEPHLTLTGKKDRKYILAIDPSFSSSPDSDDFAMGVFELDEVKKEGILVHNYAVHGGNPKDHIDYFFYIVTHFNIVFVITDNSDGNFIEVANETVLLKSAGLEFHFLEDWDDGLENQDRARMLQEIKRKYNLTGRRICIKHLFNSESIRKTNEHLQMSIDFKRVWFGSRIRPDEVIFERVANQKVPVHLTRFKDNKNPLGELIDEQDNLIGQVKKQCALIEVRTSPQGNQTFELPQHLRRSKAENRARRDSYTALMLGNWATKIYFEIMDFKAEEVSSTFDPIFIR
jgi:hypothetical protein